MGTTNHGTQEITVEYYETASSFAVNKRNVDIVPRGIYSGGHLTRVSDVEVTLSPFTAELGDDDIQISVKTAASATLKAATLDSGDIDAATPYLVLRWSYAAQQHNYVEIHAIASVSAAQDNDIIIGKCEFSGATLTGFDYSDRTFLNVQDLFLKVEEDSGLYVWIRAGRIQNSSGHVFVPEQQVGPFTAPSSPNSRIDLVYVDTDGTVSIEQGTAAVSPSAPSYSGKLVVAEVTVVNGDTSIPASRIRDVRSFLTRPSGYDGTSVKVDDVGNLSVGNIFGNWETKLNNTVYLASTDGFVLAMSSGISGLVRGYTDGSSPPTTQRHGNQDGSTSNLMGMCMPVRKGDYWKVTGAGTVSWLPVGS